MSLGSLALAACAAALIASPAQAQGAAELLGVYHLTMTSKSGTDCPDDDEEDLSVEIRRISGEKLMFGEAGDTDEEIAQYDPLARTFRFEQAASEGGSQQNGVFTGRFTRQLDSVRLDMTVDIQGCTGKMTGFRPAPMIAPAAPALPVTTAAPSGVTPAAPGAQPATPAAPVSNWMSNPLVLGGGGLLLLLVGAGVGLVLGRRKPEAEKPEPAPTDGSDA